MKLSVAGSGYLSIDRATFRSPPAEHSGRGRCGGGRTGGRCTRDGIPIGRRPRPEGERPPVVVEVTLTAGSTIKADGKAGGAVTVQSTSGTTSVSGDISAKGSEGKGGDVKALGERFAAEFASLAVKDLKQVAHGLENRTASGI